jgi:hypothetical protein
MKKAISYRLFGLGSVPKKLRPVLEAEGIVVLDEGMRGRFMAKSVRGPGKYHRHRIEGFSGWLAVTRERVVCYSYGKRQMNISVHDPKLSELRVEAPDQESLSISFESSVFREGWQGVIQFRFKTDEAHWFQDVLGHFGAGIADIG